MSKKSKKRKKKKPEKEFYQIEIEDWKVNHHFGVHLSRNVFGPEDFREDSCLTLLGTIGSPIIKNVTRAIINFCENPELDDHLKGTSTERPSSIGWMEVLRDKITLNLTFWIPSRLFKNISLSMASGKTKYASVCGEKLKWGRGSIFWVSLSTTHEEE